ncbi:hypothetical protein GCM10010390_52950 [Streptomyces mordarskii]|uniref:Uncharacterized protein n=1 Tax=Streptomyces mordarskii TaxID=1226758 RepID=A0ABN1DJK8_9ACTN
MNDHFLDDADLTDRMEQNLAEHACHLHRSMTGAAVTEAGDLLVADSGLDDDTFNIVAAARFTAADATARITETAESLARTGRRFSWWVGPASTPLDLTTLLTAAGLPASERETAMWAELDDTLPPPTVQGLDIQTVATPEQLADYASAPGSCTSPPGSPGAAAASAFGYLRPGPGDMNSPSHSTAWQHYPAPPADSPSPPTLD